MMDRVILKSPAKVNLYLNVLGRRPNGYHEIETVIQAIDLCDRITLRRREGPIEVICDSQEVLTGFGNLAYRAAALLRKQTGQSQGVDIKIEKEIPVASGLGGGASNAAVVLLGLNRLWDLGLSSDRLIEFARSLGADVPFFVAKASSAIARGKGDELTALDKSKTFWLILVTPQLKVYTKDVYGSLNILPFKTVLTKREDNVKILIHALKKGDVDLLGKSLYNSLEDIVSKKYEVISQIKQHLLSWGAKGALMSGSGPTVFGLTSNRKEAIGLRDKISGHRGWRVFVAKAF